MRNRAYNMSQAMIRKHKGQENKTDEPSELPPSVVRYVEITSGGLLVQQSTGVYLGSESVIDKTLS